MVLLKHLTMCIVDVAKEPQPRCIAADAKRVDCAGVKSIESEKLAHVLSFESASNPQTNIIAI